MFPAEGAAVIPASNRDMHFGEDQNHAGQMVS